MARRALMMHNINGMGTVIGNGLCGAERGRE